MQWLVLAGVDGLDGRYEFDLEGRELTTREWGWIKRHSGYMPLTVDTGFDGADPELFACFALIALVRAGKVVPRETAVTFERIIDGPFSATVNLESDPVEEATEDSPPPSSSTSSDGTSGDASRTSSGIPAPYPSRTGMPVSGSSPSAQAR